MALDAAGPRGGRPPNFDAIYIKHGDNAAALPAAEAEFAAAMDAHRDAKRHRIAEEMEIKPRLPSPGNPPAKPESQPNLVEIAAPAAETVTSAPADARGGIGRRTGRGL